MSVTSAVLVLGGGLGLAFLAISVALPAMTNDQTLERRVRRRGVGVSVLAGAAACALVVLGVVLWVPRAGKTSDANSDLGSALLGAAAVAFAVLFLERRFEADARGREELAATERRRQDDRQHAQMLTALRRDLPGVDLRGRDLSGFYLRGWNLRRGRFDDANLDGVNLSGADLTGATFERARLQELAYLEGASLSGAVLEGAVMEGAYLRGADLSSAYLRRVELAGANLGETDLRDTDLREAIDLSRCDLRGARYDERTRWPERFEPELAGAIRIASADPWRCSGTAAAQAE